MFTHRSLLPEEIILVLVSVIPITFGISVVKYHIMDIDHLINRSVVYALVIVVLLGIYLLIIGLLTNIAVTIDLKVSSIFTALIIALLFQPVRNRVQKFVDKKFFKVQYNFREAIINIFSEMNESNDLPSLYNKIIIGVDKLVQVEKIGYFTLNKLTNRLRLAAHKNFDLLVNRSVKFERENLKTDLSLPVALPNKVEPGVNIEQADVRVFLRWGINLVLAVKSSKKEILGFLVLGSKKSGAKFSIEDIDLLNTIISRAAVSIDRIKLQEELILKRIEAEKLDELSQLKTYFVSSVSHDMKTPLTSIKIFAELLQAGGESKSEKSKEYLEIIEGESSRLSRLIDNVLDYSKIERGIKQYQFERIGLNEIVSQTLKMMQYQFKLHNFSVETNLSNAEIIIYADKDAIEEAIINLFSNAIKYSKEKKIIRISTKTEEEYITLSVADEGMGMDKKHLENIFNPFFRIGLKEVQNTGGAGLGLSIIRHIMDAHKGKIEVQSEFGKGSCFILYFPIKNN
jgi:signal transduction histidine kinase